MAAESLQTSFLSPGLKQRLWAELWQSCRPTTLINQNRASSYLDFYLTKCHRCARQGGTYLLLRDHSHLINVAKLILNDEKRNAIEASLLNQYPATGSTVPQDEIVDTTMNLCGSVLLMTETGTYRNCLQGISLSPIPWAGKESLRDAVAGHFQAQKSLMPDKPRFESIFNARNIHKMAGITIKWTCNLADHLHLKDDDKTLLVFHCVTFLEHQKSFQTPIFPPGLVEETLRTLTLLLPESDRQARFWINEQIATHKVFKLDEHLAQLGPSRARERRFENFSYWHDRLVMLKQAFDDSTPSTPAQWWHDRRNMVQWYTFWVAIIVFLMTLFFGMIQSIEGGMQVYLSWKPAKGS